MAENSPASPRAVEAAVEQAVRRYRLGGIFVENIFQTLPYRVRICLLEYWGVLNLSQVHATCFRDVLVRLWGYFKHDRCRNAFVVFRSVYLSRDVHCIKYFPPQMNSIVLYQPTEWTMLPPYLRRLDVSSAASRWVKARLLQRNLVPAVIQRRLHQCPALAALADDPIRCPMASPLTYYSLTYLSTPNRAAEGVSVSDVVGEMVDLQIAPHLTDFHYHLCHSDRPAALSVLNFDWGSSFPVLRVLRLSLQNVVATIRLESFTAQLGSSLHVLSLKGNFDIRGRDPTLDFHDGSDTEVFWGWAPLRRLRVLKLTGIGGGISAIHLGRECALNTLPVGLKTLSLEHVILPHDVSAEALAREAAGELVDSSEDADAGVEFVDGQMVLPVATPTQFRPFGISARELRAFSLSHFGASDPRRLVAALPPSVRKLRLKNCSKLTDETVALVPSRMDVSALSLPNCRLVTGSFLDDAAAAHECEPTRTPFGSLRLLNASGTHFRDDMLTNLPPTLQSLELGRTGIAEGLAALHSSSFPNLRCLRLQRCAKITDSHLSGLLGYPDDGPERTVAPSPLVELRLESLELTDATLCRLPSTLEILHVIGSPHVTAAGGIFHLPPALRFLRLSELPNVDMDDTLRWMMNGDDRLPQLRVLVISGVEMSHLVEGSMKTKRADVELMSFLIKRASTTDDSAGD